MGLDDQKRERAVVFGRVRREGGTSGQRAGARLVAERDEAPRFGDVERRALRAAHAPDERVQVVGRLEAGRLQQGAAAAGEPCGACRFRGQGRHELAGALSCRPGDQRVGDPPRQGVAPVEERAGRQHVEGAVESRGDDAHAQRGRAVALAMAVDAEEGVPVFQQVDQVAFDAGGHERLQVRPASLLKREHGEERQHDVSRQFFARDPAEQPRAVVRPPPQAGHALGGRQRPFRAALAFPRRDEPAFGVGKQQVGGVQLGAVAMAARIGVARGHAGDQHFVAGFQHVVDHAGEPLGAGAVQTRHVLEHHEEGRGVQAAQTRGDDAAVEVAQEAGAAPVHPEHMLERKDGVGVLASQGGLAEAVGGDEEARDVTFPEQPRDEVGAGHEAADGDAVGPTALAGRRFEEF